MNVNREANVYNQDFVLCSILLVSILALPTLFSMRSFLSSFVSYEQMPQDDSMANSAASPLEARGQSSVKDHDMLGRSSEQVGRSNEHVGRSSEQVGRSSEHGVGHDSTPHGQDSSMGLATGAAVTQSVGRPEGQNPSLEDILPKGSTPERPVSSNEKMSESGSASESSSSSSDLSDSSAISDLDMHGSSDGEDALDAFEEEPRSWVEWFCGLRGNEIFVEVDEEYLHDVFNYAGLQVMVPYYRQAFNTLIDVEEARSPTVASAVGLGGNGAIGSARQSQVHVSERTSAQDDGQGGSANQSGEEGSRVDPGAIDAAAQVLYGLLHARFLLTNKGLEGLMAKYEKGVYGYCWNAECAAVPQAVLPIGSSSLGESTTRVYCPRCGEVYHPRVSRLDQVDGAYFGSTAAHLLLMTFPSTRLPIRTEPHTLTLFGFRLFTDETGKPSATSSLSRLPSMELTNGKNGSQPKYLDDDSSRRGTVNQL